MNEILFRYERLDPTTWSYLSALLIIAIFFKFNRILSIRNLDLGLILALAPGLLLIRTGIEIANTSIEQAGYWSLFAVNGLLLFRMLSDTAMIRRPLLEPNMNAPGMAFLASSLFMFLMANIVTGAADESDLYAVQRAHHLSQGESSDVERSTLDKFGPGMSFGYLIPEIVTTRMLGDDANLPAEQPVNENGAIAPDGNDPEATTLPEATPSAPIHPSDSSGDRNAETTSETTTGDQRPFTRGQILAAKIVAIVCQFLIVIGMVLIGARHFGHISMGIAAVMLYLLLPYTAMWTGSGTHIYPAVLLIWTVYFYRRPMIAGTLLGLAFGTFYYPAFLLPLWISFYRHRGLWRLLIGIGIALVALIITQICTSTDFAMLTERMQEMFGIRWPQTDNLSGAWRYWSPFYRWPILATFLGLSLLTMPLWPTEKNLGALLSCSAALMLGVQFWHAHSGGLALAWYLPLLLLTIFRPNLEERTALNDVRDWQRKRATA